MQGWQEEHFRAWLGRSVSDDEREAVERRMRTFMVAHPRVLRIDPHTGGSLGWPEIRALAEREL